MKNKKLFGKDFGTVITFILCLVAAVLFWLFVKVSMLRGSL